MAERRPSGSLWRTGEIFVEPAMRDRTTHDADEGMWRFLADLRSGAERRSETDRRQRERRKAELPVSLDRRRGTERRRLRDRRALGDRRRPPAAQFSWEHTRMIHQMLAVPGPPVACPRCRGTLMLGPVNARDGLSLREVLCTGCRHSAAVIVDAT
jgi:hypothetical protein